MLRADLRFSVTHAAENEKIVDACDLEVTLPFPFSCVLHLSHKLSSLSVTGIDATTCVCVWLD